MDGTSLVVSDPPHDVVEAARAASLLSLSAAEARMKANFAAPEIWLALDTEAAFDAKAELTATGLAVCVVDAASLAELPKARHLRSFELGEDRMKAELGDGSVALPYHAAVTGVFGTAAPGGAEDSDLRAAREATRGRRSGLHRDRPTAAGQAGAASSRARTFFELYVDVPGEELTRLSITDRTDFSGLEALKVPRARDNMVNCVMACARRFPTFDIDTRMVHMRLRARPTVGGAVDSPDGRKLYSFGTMRLRSLLEQIDPTLSDLDQFELGSRLGYLTYQARAGVAV